MGRLPRNQRPNVLFGYDGTQENDAALRWAVAEARTRELALVICHCWHWPYPPGHVDDNAEAVIRRAGERLLERGARRARDLGADTVRRRLRSEPVREALVRESEDAELIVVGTHECHRLAAGSTAMRLPAQARRPVIAVRHAAPSRGLVVAGVDGSAGGEAALGLAVDEAVLRGWPLRVVYGAWEPGAVPESELPLFTDKARLARTRAAMLERVTAPWRERCPDLDMQVSLVLERPREALLDAARDADLLVVGDRGTGQIDPLLLGATSSAMLHHAPCTVAIVPQAGPPSGSSV
ncbi:universal stress protein [Actinomadura litoris]|uniref:Universal stress protein n=1 Tax=Actinomadura litoris TaxID=2678616 RepID=A0A7K1L5F4_9ACTN|nr:universal stress protein [Actinomadura litoris]MUN39650.1 universal stress protein [Actinomadura litoris]